MPKNQFLTPAGLAAENLIREVGKDAFTFYAWLVQNVTSEFEYYGERIGSVLGGEPHTEECLSDYVRQAGIPITELDVSAWLKSLETLGLVACVNKSRAGKRILVIGSDRLPQEKADPLPYYDAPAVSRAIDLLGLGGTAFSIGVRLLVDIKAIFDAHPDDVGKIGSRDLASALGRMKDRPWSDWLGGAPIGAPAIARLLKQYRIWPRTMRLADHRRLKGYDRRQFLEAWQRYCE